MKLSNIFYLFLLLFLFASCSSKKKQSTEEISIIRPSEIETTMQDSIEVENLVKQYMSSFSKGDLESASKMLYTVRNDSVIPYTSQEREDFKNHLSIFHVYDYELSGLAFRSEKNNEIDVTIQIVPDGSIAEKKGTTQFVLNPIKKNNHWYLTLMNLRAEGVRRD